MNLEIANFIVGIAILCALLYLSYLALQFTAKPKIKIDFKGEQDTGKTQFRPIQKAVLEFTLQNIGHWYAKPVAIDNTFYFKFDPQFQLKNVRYGSMLENQNNNSSIGKEGKKYFKIKEQYLLCNEPAQQILIEVIMPSAQKTYSVSVFGKSSQSDHGAKFFEVTID